MEKFYSIYNHLNKFLDRHFFYFVIFLLIFIPLYPKFPSLNIAGTYVAIRAEDFLIVFVNLFWLIFHFKKLKAYFCQTIFQAFILFWLIGALSLLSALLITYFVEPHLGFLHWLRRVEYMSLFIIAATSFYSIRQVKIALWALIVTLLIVIVYGFGQIWLDFPVISTTNKEFSKGLILYLTDGARVSGTFAGHYDLAVYLSILLMFLGSLFFYFKNIFYKLPILFLGIFSFLLLGLTAARISFIAAILGLALIFWLSKKKIFLIGLVVVAICSLMLIPDLRHRMVATFTVNILQGGGPKYSPPKDQITVFTNLSRYPESSRAALLEKAILESTTTASLSGVIAADTAPGEPINTTELGVYRSWGIRLNVEWPRALNAFYKNPILGTGYSSISLATDNDYLRSLGETGLLGTLSLGLIIFIIIRKMRCSLKITNGLNQAFILATSCSLFVFLITGLFIDVLEASKIAEFFWIILGINWAIMNKNKNS